MLTLSVYFLSFLLVIVMILFLIKSGQKSSSRRVFAWLVISVLAWMSMLAIADFIIDKPTAALALNLAIFFFSLVTWLLLLFSLEYNNTSTLFIKTKKYFYTVGFIYNLVYLYAAITSSVITNITISDFGVSIASSTVLYDIHVVQANIFAILSIIFLNFRKDGFDSNKKHQIRIMTTGFFIAAVGNILSGAVAAYLPGYDWLNMMGTFSIAIFITLIGYAIIKHKLFDVRIIVARSMAYTLSVSVLAIFYSLLMYGIGGQALRLDNITYPQKILFILLALIMATTFHPLILFFNKITNKVFFRDIYDTQLVLDKISRFIVGSIDPHRIQKGVLNTLDEALNPSYAIFLLSNNDKLIRGDGRGKTKGVESNDVLYKSLKSAGREVIVRDALENKNIKLKNILQEEDISVVSPLVTKNEPIGYLLLGPKKSGNMYNTQDVGLLNIASNELAVALQNAQRFEEIQLFNETLQSRIAEATEELKRTNRKLVSLDEAKDEFISMASHQLRTPLTSIKGYISMILEGDLGKISTAQEKALSETLASSQRMVFLIADFLNVSRIKTGKFVIELSEVDLPLIVQEELTQLRDMAASRDLKLKYEQPEVFPKVKLDENKIRQVMMNMIDNAIYYTPAKGAIAIQLYPSSDEIIFKVIDSGIGVPKKDQHKLFTKFFRANNAKKARPDGTGLGLFMAQKIIAEQGGSIIFESTEGKGSTFGFRFPLKKVKV